MLYQVDMVAEVSQCAMLACGLQPPTGWWNGLRLVPLLCRCCAYAYGYAAASPLLHV
jgi:hypothetical protein